MPIREVNRMLEYAARLNLDPLTPQMRLSTPGARPFLVPAPRTPTATASLPRAASGGGTGVLLYSQVHRAPVAAKGRAEQGGGRAEGRGVGARSGSGRGDGRP